MATLRENQLIDVLVGGIQNTPEFLSLDPSTRQILNQTVEGYIRSNAGSYIQQVDQTSNFQLGSIPNNAVGINNPLDLVGSNLSSSDVATTLTPVVQNDLSNNLTVKLADGIINSFASKLPPIIRSSVNTGFLRSGITASASTSVPQAIEGSISSFSSDLMSGKSSFPAVVPNISALFANPAAGLPQINQRYASSLSNEALSEASQFDTNNTQNQEKLIVQSVGFIDPSAQYPTKEYNNRSEVNKLATGDVNGTVVQTKEKERRKGIQLPNGASFEQPPIPYCGEYPYNKVIQTESGHIIETDDTPGAERIQVYHRSGTFIEIDSNGSVVRRTKGSSYEIVDKNGYISINGDASVSVKGSVKVYIGGDADIEVEGDVNLNCFNDITMQAAGRVDISATEEINLHSANINIEADVNLNVRSDNDSRYSAGGEMYHKANSTIYHQSLAGYNIRAVNNINLDSNDNIYLNSSRAEGSQYAFNANIGLIGNRKDVIYTTIPDPISPTYLDRFGLNAEDSEFPEEGDEQQRLLKQLGVASSDDLSQSQIPLGTETPVSTNTTVIQPSSFVLSQSYLPDNFQLSKHFTLDKVSSKAAVSNYPVQAQLGLSYGEIVFNLQGIALNILEPVLALYPNMFVTSGFRTAANSSTLSDHPRGKAVDMQFRGVSRIEYFEIAKRLAENLNYDKLLLEYKTYGTGMPWIHISFDVNQTRKQVFTYFNDKKYGSGLTSFA